MEIKIKDTGEIKTLEIRTNNGIEWTQDLIGNAGALADGQFVWSDEDDAYVADQGTYDWWAQYIRDTEATESEVAALAEELGLDAADISMRIDQASGGDYEDHRPAAVRVMQEMRDERRAASLLGRKGGSVRSERKTAAVRANGRRGGRPRKLTPEQDHIVDRLGAGNWRAVEAQFAGRSEADILAILDDLFPTEDNEDLARRIHAALP